MLVEEVGLEFLYFGLAGVQLVDQLLGAGLDQPGISEFHITVGN
jgi:hypothetical protein